MAPAASTGRKCFAAFLALSTALSDLRRRTVATRPAAGTSLASYGNAAATESFSCSFAARFSFLAATAALLAAAFCLRTATRSAFAASSAVFSSFLAVAFARHSALARSWDVTRTLEMATFAARRSRPNLLRRLKDGNIEDTECVRGV